MNPPYTMNTLSSEDFNMKKPEEVIKPEFLETYKALHSDIWRRLILVHTNIIILEKIEKFPFEHIYAPQENIFWTMVYWNFLYVSIAFLHSLVSDETKGAHTLPKFKNSVLNHLRTDSLKSIYRKRLKNAKLDENLSTNRKKISQMRHNVIAHSLLDSDSIRLMDVEGVSLDEIRQAHEDVEKLFRACSFGAEYVTSFYINGTVGGKPIQKDIDYLLDLILKDSAWLNKPERKKDFWAAIRKNMSEEDITELNEFRKKFGMPPV